ncbi:MAG: monovalent cation/H+ antiporter subunit D family protein [Planctomycetota bacterium]|nr:monovalent cation/H+ antiporter subunit D family protein [Planctomycetota bacterium]
MLQHLPVLTIMVPMFAGLLVPLLARVHAGIVRPLTIGALGFSCFAAIHMLLHVQGGHPIEYAMGGWPIPTGIGYRVDGLNAMVLVMIAVIGLLTALWMRRSIEDELPAAARPGYHAVLLLACTGFLGITITADIFNLYVFLEIASITSYVLIAMGRRRQALYAGYSYLIVGSIGATFILLGIGHLYMRTGSLAMADILAQFQANPDLYGMSDVRMAFAFLVVGLAIKMALFPLHGWQPGAYTHAPSASSLFIAATSTKVSAYALYRIVFSVFGTEVLVSGLPPVRDALLAMACAAIVLGPLIAISQGDLKRLLAYSSVGQIGYIVLGLMLLDERGLTGGIIHFWNHAAAKGALFCVAGALVLRTGAARVDDLAGLGRRAPWTASAVTVAGCSMVGVPLTAGFLSKWYLATGALATDRLYVVPVLLASSGLTAVYVWRILQKVWFAPADVEPRVGAEVPWSMRLPTLVLAAACLVFGIAPWSVEFARDAIAALGIAP